MSDHKPRVSIGLPVYNGERFLKEALDSLLAQTYSDFELIISDNASTDQTEAICRTYAAKDSRICYYRNEHNRGAAWNFNHVFELSTGEYFKWAAHDDVCAPEHIQRCVEVLDRLPSVVLCYPKTTIIDEHGKPIKNYIDGFNLRSPRPHERFHEFFYSGGLTNAIHGVIRANTLKRVRQYGKYASSDRVLLAELALLSEFYEVPENLFFRRDHPQTSGRANSTITQYATWLDPADQGKIQLLTWRWFFEYLICIRRVRIGWYEKACCYVQMARWFRWNWRDMRNELVVAAKDILYHSGPIRKSVLYWKRAKY